MLELNATRLPDHRIAYLDYEGPLSGDRGHVTRVDQGDYAIVSESPDCLEVCLQGHAAAGQVRLSHSEWR